MTAGTVHLHDPRTLYRNGRPLSGTWASGVTFP